MRQYAKSLLMLFMISSQMLSCTGPELQKHLASERDVILYKGGWENNPDIRPYEEIASELGLTTKVVDGDFINETRFSKKHALIAIIMEGPMNDGHHLSFFQLRIKWVLPIRLTHQNTTSCRSSGGALPSDRAGTGRRPSASGGG